MPSRCELFEFTDAPWLPAVLRRGLTSYLHAAHSLLHTERYFAPKVAAVAREAGISHIVDLGSGSGGPLPSILRALGRDHGVEATATLTDLYPDVAAVEAINAGGGAIRYHPTPVDAAGVPPEFAGIRTIICGFHHLRPDAARRVLRDAREKGQPICVFETTQNSAPAAIAMLVLMPFLSLLLTPFARPITFGQLFFTYLVPVLPPMLTWDGFVSVLRTYGVGELRAMTADLAGPDYRWEAGTIDAMGNRWPYLIGTPTRAG